MLYPEISHWFSMGSLIYPLSLTSLQITVILLLQAGKLDADRYVGEDRARKAYRFIRVILALMHWRMFIAVREMTMFAKKTIVHCKFLKTNYVTQLSTSDNLLRICIGLQPIL